MIKLFLTQNQYHVNIFIFIFEYIFTIIFNDTIFCFYTKLLSSFYHTRGETKKKKILCLLKAIFQKEIEKSLFCSHGSSKASRKRRRRKAMFSVVIRRVQDLPDNSAFPNIRARGIIR